MNISFPYEKNKPLSKLSTFGIGGPALIYTEVKSLAEMEERLLFAKKENLPFFILGKGSNCLFDDVGFQGIVIKNCIDSITERDGLFTVGAGFGFARLGTLTAKSGWKGLEFASGIPATVGGALYMNAGANGHETADTLVAVTYLNEKGELESFKKKDLEFSYRYSSFQRRRGAIVEATFQLRREDGAKDYQKKLLNYRLHTQPYGDKSAGCAFRNPQNVAAGRIIEECGMKGERVGDAEISTLHANFIINRGSASSQDVLALIEKVKETVLMKKNILLEEEIRYIHPHGLQS